MRAVSSDLEPLPESEGLRRRFLDGMSHAASSVSVITTDGIAGRLGVTVSAMVSVSADTSTLLICIHHRSAAAEAVLANGVFCVNLLREDQAHISDCFAGRTASQGADRFECARWTTLRTGAPRVIDPLVAFDCRVTASERIGSHHVIFGSVEDIFVAEDGNPLIYSNRSYGMPQRLPAMRARSETGRVALGCFQVFAPHVVPALTERLQRDEPSIFLSCLEGDQAQLLAALRRGEIEAALLYHFGLGEDLRQEVLAELVPYVLLPAGHPLAEQAAVSLAELISQPLVLLDVDPSRNYFVSLFRAQGLEPLIGHRASSLEMVRGLVGHGLGYSLLATKPANNMSYDGRALVMRPLAEEVERSRLVLASLAARPLSAGALELRRHCRDMFGVSHAHATA